MPEMKIDDLRERADEVASLLKLFSHPGRLLIACELIKGERSVSQLADKTGNLQPNLSRDLSRLRSEGLVETRRDAKQVFYRLKDHRIEALVKALCEAFGPPPEDNVANDRRSTEASS